ncbi:MAG: hypothetical protein ACK6DA_02400 [Candidatus Kapaibacterium sp.]
MKRKNTMKIEYNKINNDQGIDFAEGTEQKCRGRVRGRGRGRGMSTG